MTPWFTKIVRRKPFSREQANSVSELIHAREVRETHTHTKKIETPFVIKYFREPLGKIQTWATISRDLLSIGVPTAELENVKKTSKGVFAKQKDFSNSLQLQLHEAREFGRLNPKLAMAIVYDLAKMHKRGYVLSSNEHIFTPWIIYQKPNGELDRVIVDFGSITKHPSPKFSLNGRERSRAEHNIGILLANLTVFEKNDRIKIMKKYFSINPDPILKSKASTFMSHSF